MQSIWNRMCSLCYILIQQRPWCLFNIWLLAVNSPARKRRLNCKANGGTGSYAKLCINVGWLGEGLAGTGRCSWMQPWMINRAAEDLRDPETRSPCEECRLFVRLCRRIKGDFRIRLHHSFVRGSLPPPNAWEGPGSKGKCCWFRRANNTCRCSFF